MDVTLFGEQRCHKVRFYKAALEERNVAFEFAAIDEDAVAKARLAALFDGQLKFPTLLIKGKKVRNPSLGELDKHLARAGLFDPGLIHNVKAQRFVRYMAPSDAFVSYGWQGERMILGHIEVDKSLRGQGIGEVVALEVFEAVSALYVEVRLTCPFLRNVASKHSNWRSKFAIGE